MNYADLRLWQAAEADISHKLRPTLEAVKVAPLWRATNASVRILFSACAQHVGAAGPCSHTEDEHALMWLGCRVVTSTLAAVRLLLAGYYGPALALTRDSVESTMLLALFEAVPEELAVWRGMADDPRARWRRFQPRVVRDRLAALGAFHRYEEYDLYSGLAGHPTPGASRLSFSEEWERRMVGPFADAENAERTLHAVALSAAHGAFQVADVLKVQERFEAELKELMDALDAWSHPENGDNATSIA